MLWREAYLGGSLAAEEAFFKQFAQDISTIQEENRTAARGAKIRRGFHAKRHIATHRAKFFVSETLPALFTHGLFQAGEWYDATIRFSNASGRVQPDNNPDERGLAIRLSKSGMVIQDFLLSNSPTSHARDAHQFMAFGFAFAKYGPLLGIFKLLPILGIAETFRIARVLKARTGRRIASLATEQFWSRTPFALGATALKFTVVPSHRAESALPDKADNYLSDAIIQRLKDGPLDFSFRVQTWDDEASTPIEDGSIEWTSPFTELGRLHIETQDLSLPEREEEARAIDRLAFSPWTVTTTLKPIGSLNRARNPVYRASAERRKDRPALALAENVQTTPFDYIIVGSGAGGGPLAARLAQAGKIVLLIEAGKDPASARPSVSFPTSQPGEVHDVPGYYAAATEDPEMSWMFSVRHYENEATQRRDAKYNAVPVDPNSPVGMPGPLGPKYLDPQPPSHPGKRGIFYPRSSGLGGCTGHHAMIVVAPNDRDWNEIADLTGDLSWRAENMQNYFTKLERCLYLDEFKFFPGLQKWAAAVRSFFGFHPAPDNSGHGLKGWQPTSHISRDLIFTILWRDRPLIRLLVNSVFSVFHREKTWLGFWKWALFHSRTLQKLTEPLDFNDHRIRRTHPEGIFPIPLGVDGGRRVGVREFLLKTRDEFPERLVIASGLHVTKVLFRKDEAMEVPQAIGVECRVGDHLYAASPMQQRPAVAMKSYFCKGEVILSGGSFNTPQILMLSGIGDQQHLEERGIAGLCGEDGKLLAQVGGIHLPGVGRNLQDRYEISVISRLDQELSTLNGISFRPGDLDDPARRQWMQNRTGLYATNGGILSIIRRSSALQANEPEPDLFTFGVPAAFRGYYWNWSRELLRPAMGEPEERRNLWSWVVLKAYTQNDGGTVRLRTADPLDMPDICFHSFEETPGAPIKWKKDLKALMDAVAFIRKINADHPKEFVEEIQPGEDIVTDSFALEEWIKTQAWGHHACGTCRIGKDAWKADPVNLEDVGAVLDSEFRIHGVKGLRVVDASVFPKIPGYFILAPIFMVSEKAADVMLDI